MIHSIDSQGVLIFVSDLWLAKLGYARDEVIVRPFADFLTLASREHAIKNILPDFFRTGRCENIEYQMAAKDGRILDVLLTSNLYRPPPFEDESWSIAVTTDISELKAARQLLNERETMFRSLIEDQPELVSLVSPDGTYRFVNNALARAVGLEPPDFLGRNVYDFLAPAHHSRAAGRIAKLNAGSPLVIGESQLQTRDNGTRWISWTHRAIRDADGNLSSIHSVGRDVEERMANDRRLKENEARYRLLADNSTDMVIQIGRDRHYEYVSPACRELLGYEPDSMIGATFGNLTHPEDAARVTDNLQSLLEGKSQRQQIINRVRHRDGRWIWLEGHFRAVTDPGSGEITGLTGALRDISARKIIEDQLAEANRRLEELATMDELTGLNNRRGFDQCLAKEYRRAERDQTPLSLIMIDADHFKSFNDRYGHLAGDGCLRKIGECVKLAIRRPGDVAVRYGGEEFAVLLPGTGEEGALMIAEKIRKDILRLAIPHADSSQHAVTISAGVATAGPQTFEREPSHLIGLADSALYHAKASNRNQCVRASRLHAAKTLPAQPTFRA